jgi:hypothetical protein
MKKIINAALLLTNVAITMGLLAGASKGDSMFVTRRSVVHLIVFVILLVLNMFFLGLNAMLLESKQKDRNKFLILNLIRFGFPSVVFLIIFLLNEFLFAKVDPVIITMMSIIGIYTLIVSITLVRFKKNSHNTLSKI